jgi:hypothetical protein
MSCERWQEAILGRLYAELEPEEDRALTSHLEACGACVASLEDLRRVRVSLRENEPEVPRLPRVMVLRDAPRLRPALLAASLATAALLAGAGAGAGYALGRQGTRAEKTVPIVGSSSAATLDPATEALIRQEVASRLDALRASAQPDAAAAIPAGVTKDEFQTALTKLERRMETNRAADFGYMMGEIEASEVRTGARIGQTNQALRYVALASNPNVSER